ncbi:MAG: peptidoglycan DD-metalloendopeptidase family protein, partial [Parcubacteria group bacterium]
MKNLLWLVMLAVLVVGYLYIKPNPEETRTVNNLDPGTSSSIMAVVSEKISLSISPETVIQGEPVLITINGLYSTSTIKSLALDDKPLPVFMHNGKPTSLVGIDLRGKIGSYQLVLNLKDGQKIEEKLVIGKRIVAKETFNIPEKFGGDTPEAEKKLVSTLLDEGAIINAVPTSADKLWNGNFHFPLDEPITVTDTYGYSRLTGGSSISHKGTDFRARVGTPVYAMNSGLVRFVESLRNYGDTIIIDHGLGLLTIYMHLSEMNVELGDKVEKDELIGKSGSTGYTHGPHLHLTIRIKGISIDPMKFMEL